MGTCCGRQRNINYPSQESSDASGIVSVGRNQPLKTDKPKWKSDVPITEGQLRSRRDEFWETMPAFGGHREIWDALRAAANALETGDLLLAQAIVDGANISTPTGSLAECYDELGSRYILPPYVLSPPTNLVDENSYQEQTLTTSSAKSDGDKTSGTKSPRRTTHRGAEIPIRIQLSTGREIKLTVRTTDTIGTIKQRVNTEFHIPTGKCRVFFAGRQLVDKSRVKDARIMKNYTIQLILAEKEQDQASSRNGSKREGKDRKLGQGGEMGHERKPSSGSVISNRSNRSKSRTASDTLDIERKSVGKSEEKCSGVSENLAFSRTDERNSSRHMKRRSKMDENGIELSDLADKMNINAGTELNTVNAEVNLENRNIELVSDVDFNQDSHLSQAESLADYAEELHGTSLNPQDGQSVPSEFIQHSLEHSIDSGNGHVRQNSNSNL